MVNAKHLGPQIPASTLLAVACVMGRNSAAWRALQEAKVRTNAGEEVAFYRGKGRHRHIIFVGPAPEKESA